MDAFESIVAMLLRREGYWTASSYKVVLTKQEKRHIKLPSSPRRELDLIAYRGSTNEVLAVECKSFLDSPGVYFGDGTFWPPNYYKLFVQPELRETVLARLRCQLVECGACRPNPKVTLCLAAGHIHRRTDVAGLRNHFEANHWLLFDPQWVAKRLASATSSSYENDIALMTAKLLSRNPGCLQ